MSINEVLQAALALSAEERVQLIDELLVVCDEHGDLALDDAWLAEIERRSDEFDAGKVSPIPWSVVKARAAKGERLRG